MDALLICNEDLIRQLPLPLAQLYRRAHNAKTPQERHHAAYYLWEASLKLLGSVAIVEYAESSDQDPELGDRLQNLARPALGHWWEFVRRLTPVLAERGDRGFVTVRDLLLGRTRDDLPHTAGLDAVLIQVLEGKKTPQARSTVRLTELFDRLVRYRNREFGHGATGQKPAAFYDRVGRALLAGIPELLERLDPLAGRRLLYTADVRRLSSGRWLVERCELKGESHRRLESLDLPDRETVRRLLPDRLYLESVSWLSPAPEPVVTAGATDEATELEKPRSGDIGPRVVSLHPLVVYDSEIGEALFMNARRGKQRIEYLSYTTGRELERADLGQEQRELLARVLRAPVDALSVHDWAERSQAEQAAEEIVDAPSALRRLGEFELLSQLGSGGMGRVYRAWQPSLARQVAVKSLYQMGEPKAEARFAREIKALAQVEHPHLVKIFTSGSEGERWFYAMELIEGATLSAVCDRLQARSTCPDSVDFQTWQQAVSTVCAEARRAERPLGDTTTDAGHHSHPVAPAETDASYAPLRAGRNYVRQVVELTKQIAEAAHALHERGILHRDIKPGNIMVTADGNQAVLMDLGLAQLADEVEGRLTKTRQFVGTLRYASPEQVLAVGGLDRRTDVYSLGATLWELLTLRPMFHATDQMPTPDLMRRIQIEDPEGPRKHHPGLSRDLEAIVLKCLEKDPNRRYATARELVRDLEHYQVGEPVVARPVGNIQRTWRWCRRNPVLAGMLGLLAAVIVGSFAGLSALYLNAEAQRQVAEQQRRAADEQRKLADQERRNAERDRKLAEHREAGASAVSKFYENHVLAAARPKGWSGGVGKDVTLKQALDRAGPEIEKAFAGQSELEAVVRDALGMTYYYLGQFKDAVPHLESAFEIRSRVLGEKHPDTLASHHNLAMLRWKMGNFPAAIALARDALRGRTLSLGADHADTLFTQMNLGLFLWESGQLDESEQVLRQAVTVCQRVLGPEHHHTLYAQNDLACVLNSRGRHEEALALDRATLEGRRRSLGPDHPDTLRSMGNLAFSLDKVGEIDETTELLHQTVAERRRILGPDHPETLLSLSNLAFHLDKLGELESATEMSREVLESRRRMLGAEHPSTLLSEGNLASVLRRRGQYSEAEPLLRHALEVRQRLLGNEHTDTLLSQDHLARLLADQGKVPEAEALFRRTLEVRRRLQESDNRRLVGTIEGLAAVLAEKPDFAEAVQFFGEVLAAKRKLYRPDHLELAVTLSGMGRLHIDRGQPAEAEPLILECLTIREKKLPTGNWQISLANSLLGCALMRQGKHADAEPLLLSAQEVLSKSKDAPAKRQTETLDWLIELYEKWDKPDEAERWRRHRLEQTSARKPGRSDCTVDGSSDS